MDKDQVISAIVIIGGVLVLGYFAGLAIEFVIEALTGRDVQWTVERLIVGLVVVLIFGKW